MFQKFQSFVIHNFIVHQSDIILYNLRHECSLHHAHFHLQGDLLEHLSHLPTRNSNLLDQNTYQLQRHQSIKAKSLGQSISLFYATQTIETAYSHKIVECFLSRNRQIFEQVTGKTVDLGLDEFEMFVVARDEIQ